MAQKVKGAVAGDLKEKGASAADLPTGAGGPNAEQLILHDIVDIAHPGKRTLHVGAQSTAMRINLIGKPARAVDGGRH